MKLLLVEVTEWIKYQSTKYFKTERERKSLNNAFCRLVVVVVKDEISQQTRNTNFFNVSPITFQLDGNFSLEIVYGLALVWDLKSNVSFTIITNISNGSLRHFTMWIIAHSGMLRLAYVVLNHIRQI